MVAAQPELSGPVSRAIQAVLGGNAACDEVGAVERHEIWCSSTVHDLLINHPLQRDRLALA